MSGTHAEIRVFKLITAYLSQLPSGLLTSFSSCVFINGSLLVFSCLSSNRGHPRRDCYADCRTSSCASFLLFRWRLSELQVPGRRPPSLDRLPEEQGPKGGAVAHPDQRAAANPQPRLTPSSGAHACRQSLSMFTDSRGFTAQT